MIEQTRKDAEQELLTEEDLQYFLSKAGIPPRLEMNNRYSDVFVKLGINEVLEGPKVELGQDRTAKEFLRNYGYIPKTKAEFSAVDLTDPDSNITGVALRANMAAATKKGKPEEALRNVYEHMEHLWQSAMEEVRILQSVQIEDDKGASVPDLEQIRSSQEVLAIMADYFMAREFFYKLSWPKSNQNDFKEPQRFYRGAMLAAVKLPDGGSMLMDAYSAVSKSSTERLKHLSKQRQALAQNEHVGQMVLADRGYVPGVGFVPYEELLLEAEVLEPEDEEEAVPAQEIVPEKELTTEQEEAFDLIDRQGQSSSGVAALSARGINNRRRVSQILGARAARHDREKDAEIADEKNTAREKALEAEHTAKIMSLLRAKPTPDSDLKTDSSK